MTGEDSPARVTSALVIALVLLAIVVCVTSATSTRPTANTRVAFTYPEVSSESCLPMSAAAAIARVMRLSAEVPPTARAWAKLFGTDYWAVEVDGSITPSFSHRGRYAWAVYNVDAHTGDIRSMSAGPPGSTHSDWNSLPNHTTNCVGG